MRDFFNEFKFIILFFLFLTALTGMTQVEVQQAEHSQVNAEEVSYVEPVVARAPAAIVPDQDQHISQNFFCNHSFEQKKTPTKVSKNLVMLSFKICKNSKTIESVSLTNETNGFKAQIFKPDFEIYKTDYIQLNNGSNRLSLEIILKDGQINRESLVILTGS